MGSELSILNELHCGDNIKTRNERWRENMNLHLEKNCFQLSKHCYEYFKQKLRVYEDLRRETILEAKSTV